MPNQTLIDVLIPFKRESASKAWSAQLASYRYIWRFNSLQTGKCASKVKKPVFDVVP